MEGENRDPYEKQLLAVFNSCLEKGQTELNSEGLHALCGKLQLEEQSQDLIGSLSAENERGISFETFRDALLKLLGQVQDSSCSLNAEEEKCSFRLENGPVTAKFEYIFKGNKVLNHSSLIRRNGALSREIDHSEMCGLSGTGYTTIPKEMLEQIFEKLDMDCDGLISFDEFAMLFENERSKYEESGLDWGNVSSSEVTKSSDGQTVVHILGPHHTGYALISTIIGMWEVAGVSEAAALLSELGFTSSEIRLTDLTTVLCEELKNLRDEPDNAVTSTHMRLLKGALTLYQEEVRCMNTLVEHLSGERDKLRIDVTEANERANLLAQEIDEHHVRLEKSRQEQLKQLEVRHAEIMRDLSSRCSTEREAHIAALKALDRQLESARNEEQQLRAKLADVLRENQSFENEIEALCDQIKRLKSTNGELVMKVQRLAAEHEELDTSEDSQESEQIIELVDRIKKLQTELTLLRDQNDELTSELEYTKNKSLELMKSAKDETTEARVDSSNSKSIFDDPKLDSSTVERLLGELKNLYKVQCSSDDCHFKSNISSAIARLEYYNKFKKKQITSSDGIEGSCPASQSKELLEVECEERATESLRDLVVVQTEKSKLGKCMSHSDETINVIDKNFNNLDSRNIARSKVASLRDYPPRKEEGSSLESVKLEREKSGSQGIFQSSNSEEKLEESVDVRVKEIEAKYASEKKQLVDRCAELERSLDLLRSEYEQCEDYWASKLEEERQIFEQEQKISDDKFSELIAKMAEYEEQFGPDDKTRNNDGRLSPIEEKFNLEQQYTDLEEEYEDFKTQIRQLMAQKENEIKELQDKLLSENRTFASLTDVSTQFPLNESEPENIPKENSSSTHLPVIETHSSSDWHDSTIAVSNDTPNNKCNTANCRLNPSYSNEDRGAAISNSLYTIPSSKLHDCYCQRVDAYNSMEELCRVHKTEIGRLHQKKLEIDKECANLTKQRETLMKGVAELKNSTIINRFCLSDNAEESNGSLSINVLKALNERLQAQEKKRRSLKMSLAHQQHQAERILRHTWQQHCQEVTALRSALQGTNQQLKKQIQINEEQADRLAKADILSTDLYVQNAHLMASIKRLEQHCHILAQFGGESTSV